jgi:hypothetical protein
MKKIALLIAVALIGGSYVHAQSGDPELDYIRKTYSKDKQTIVSEYMNLNTQDSAKFWPLYGAYEASRQQIATVRLNLISQYVNGYTQLTPETTDKLVRASFDNNIAQDKLNQDYYGKFKSAMGAVNAAKYMQLEIYLQTMWKAVVQSNIPLIGQLNSTKQN